MKLKINKNLKLSTILYRMIIIGIIVCISLFPLYSKVNKTIITSNNVHVYGNLLIPKDTLIHKIKGYYNNQSIHDLNILQIKEQVLDIEYLNDCKISLILPSNLIIKVVEENPIALIKILNTYNYINLDGKLLSYDPSYENYFEVPIVTLSESQLNGIINYSANLKSKILSHLKILKDNDMLQTLDGIIIGEHELELIDKNNTKIFIDDKRLNYSIKLLNIFKNQISSKKKLNDYQYINLKLENQIIVKEKI